jgi:hypothetical protein
MQACEVHAYEMHAYKVHAHETYAREMHAYEMHAHEGFCEDLARQNTVASVPAPATVSASSHMGFSRRRGVLKATI